MKSGDAINIDSDDEPNPFEGLKPFLYSCLPLIILFIVKEIGNKSEIGKTLYFDFARYLFIGYRAEVARAHWLIGRGVI